MDSRSRIEHPDLRLGFVIRTTIPPRGPALPGGPDSQFGDATAISTLGGYRNPPAAGRGGQPPCPAPAPPPEPIDPDDPDGELEQVEETPSEYFVEPTGFVKDIEDDVTFSEDGDPVRVQVIPLEGGRLDGSWQTETVIDHTFIVEFVQFRAGCRTPSGDEDSTTVRRYWVQRPTDESVLADLLVELYTLLEAPELT